MFHVKHCLSLFSYTTTMKKDIKSLSLKEIGEAMDMLHQPTFRSKQLIDWLYGRQVKSYNEMTNLPLSLRETLASSYPLYFPTIVDKQFSQDGTQKLVLSFNDSACVETVCIPSDPQKDTTRMTVCCSSQVGCAMKCDFCATGKAGFIRNLTVGEIVDQIIIAQGVAGQRVSNVVMMGQGEPFLNYDNSLEALRIINHPKFLNVGARHIAVSTCGIIPGINKFSQEPEQFTLAVSLHSANQEKRNKLMPGVSAYSLSSLKTSLLKYVSKTNRRVTLEYSMIHGVNDTKDDLAALLLFCKDLHCHINLIPLNKIKEASYQPSLPRILKTWHIELNKAAIETTIRHSRGNDIVGACGQLKNALNGIL